MRKNLIIFGDYFLFNVAFLHYFKQIIDNRAFNFLSFLYSFFLLVIEFKFSANLFIKTY